MRMPIETVMDDIQLRVSLFLSSRHFILIGHFVSSLSSRDDPIFCKLYRMAEIAHFPATEASAFGNYSRMRHVRAAFPLGIATHADVYAHVRSEKAIGAFDLSSLPFTVSLLTNPKLSIAIPSTPFSPPPIVSAITHHVHTIYIYIYILCDLLT